MILQDKEVANFHIVVEQWIQLLGGLETFTPFLATALESYIASEVPQREVELGKTLLTNIAGYYIVVREGKEGTSWLKYATTGQVIWVSSRDRAFSFLLKKHAVEAQQHYRGAKVQRKYRIAYKEEWLYESITTQEFLHPCARSV